MLMQKKLTRSKKTALIFISLVLVIVISYLIYSNFLAEKIEIIKPLEVEVETLVVPKIQSDIEDDFLNKEPYRDLKSNASLPVTIGKTGRQNPFRSIPFYFREPEPLEDLEVETN